MFGELRGTGEVSQESVLGVQLGIAHVAPPQKIYKKTIDFPAIAGNPCPEIESQDRIMEDSGAPFLYVKNTSYRHPQAQYNSGAVSSAN